MSSNYPIGGEPAREGSTSNQVLSQPAESKPLVETLVHQAKPMGPSHKALQH